MSKKPIIAVDADDTLFDENNAIRLFMNDSYGFQHTPADYDIVAPYMGYWEAIWHLSSSETMARYEKFVESADKRNLRPLPRALEVLRGLKRDYELVVVTSRDHRTVDMTRHSLAEHYSTIFSDVHFVPLWSGEKKASKAKICLEIGASYLIDDCFEHCQLAADAGIAALLFGDYGWNRAQDLVPGLTRTKNWIEVEEYFHERS